MSSPSDDDRPDEPAATTPEPPAPDPPFDPYRFGKPDHPVPPEYAPPGYVPDPPATPPPPGPPTPGSGTGGYPPPYAGGQYGSPYPSYGTVPPPVTRSQGNGKAVTALCLGIGSIVLCWLTVFDVALVIPAFVFGALALTESKRRGGAGRGMAIAGIACAVVGAVLAITFTVLATNAIDKCGGTVQRDDPGFTQCVQDNIF